MIYGVCEALIYTLRLYDTAFHYHKKPTGKSGHDHKHGHGHKHGHKQMKDASVAKQGRNLITQSEYSTNTNTTHTNRYLAGSTKKSAKSTSKKDVKEAFNNGNGDNNNNNKANRNSDGATVAKAFQKSDQKVSQYQAIMNEVTSAIETAQNSDLFLVRKLAQWVHRMNISSFNDFPYDASLTCASPTGPLGSQHDSPGHPKSSRKLEEEEVESETEEENPSEPAKVCQQCRHHDIPLRQLPELLNININLAKFNMSSRSLSSKTVKLKNGVLVPRLGFGCGMLSGVGPEAEETMYNAIRAGYRHFDTAQGYGKYYLCIYICIYLLI